MGRRYEPRLVDISHDDTRVVEARREAARPKEPVIVTEQPVQPAPTPKPAQPKATKIVVESRRAPLKPGQIPDDETVNNVIDFIFGGEKP